VLLALEAHGPLDLIGLARVMGVAARPWDLRRRYLDPLVAEGRVTLSGEPGGAYALPGDHLSLCEEAEEVRYGGVHERRIRTRTDEGRTVSYVREFGSVASSRERRDAARNAYADKREGFRRFLASKASAISARPEQDQACRELLNALDEARAGGSGEAGLADGAISELERVAPEPETEPLLALSDSEREDLRAIAAFEDRHGAGTFGWTRADAKAMFYGFGRWPDAVALERIRDHVLAAGGLAAAAVRTESEVAA